MTVPRKRKIISDVAPRRRATDAKRQSAVFGYEPTDSRSSEERAFESRSDAYSYRDDSEKQDRSVPVRVLVDRREYGSSDINKSFEGEWKEEEMMDQTRKFYEGRNEELPRFGSERFERKEDVVTVFGAGPAEFSPGKSDAPKKNFSFFEARREKFRSLMRPLFAFSAALAVVFLLVGSAAFFSRGIHLQARVLGVAKDGIDETNSAVSLLMQQNYTASAQSFDAASKQFGEASEELSGWAGILEKVASPIPILSRLTSGSGAIKAGEHLANAGKEMADMVGRLQGANNPLETKSSLLDLFAESSESAKVAGREIDEAIASLDDVRTGDIPEEYRAKFVELKNMLPRVRSALASVEKNTPAIIDMLGGNGPRKYLFLFENNQELRATGGFIGSYGLLDMKDGVIRKFFVDGIFNPDGQLSVDIIPPEPIRKISAGWSLHDSNWFLDFPTSAEKAMYFYGKTGGPTVDGVIAFTPEVMRRLLAVTGPIDMPEYGVTVTADNFIETIQYEVEVDYDKEENRPKKILSDLAPILLERMFSAKSGKDMLGFLTVLDASLREKDILLYSTHDDVESIYDAMGWSGRVRQTALDYLSVVNSNINGYKTDGVIDESISHRSKIDADGRIVDTVTITRRHNGGDTQYDWWNHVNADYMRVYVPKGSELLSAKGYTRETVESPVDYDALGFERDELVSSIESTRRVDPDSGTQIFEESGKTVFGNWVYVSPKESVTVEYTYALPFQLDMSSKELPVSLLVQKQPGTINVSFDSSLEFPEERDVSWKSSDDISVQSGKAHLEKELDTDLFEGYILGMQNGEL